MGRGAAVASTTCWGPPGQQDNEEGREDGGAHGTGLPSPRHATLLRSPLRRKRHVSLGGDPRPLLGGWEGSSWPRAKPSAPERTGRVGENPLCRAGTSPADPHRHWCPARPHPQRWTSRLPCACGTRPPGWVRTALHAGEAPALLQALHPQRLTPQPGSRRDTQLSPLALAAGKSCRGKRQT